MTAAPQSTLLAAVEALECAKAAIKYPLTASEQIDAALSLLRAALEAREEPAHTVSGLMDLLRSMNLHPHSSEQIRRVREYAAMLAASTVAADTQGDAQDAASEDAVRARFGPLLNAFGELQWRSGRGHDISHEQLASAFDAVIAAACSGRGVA